MTPKTVWSGVNISQLSKDLGLSRQAVYKWQWNAKGIPAERCLEIEKLTGIPRCQLRPDLWGYANA